jgi:hypothetical protein
MLDHWNNSHGHQVEMLLHSDTLSWFRANQSLLLLLNDAYLAEKQQIPILVFGLTRHVLKPNIYCTGGENAYTNKVNIIVEYLNTLGKGY